MLLITYFTVLGILILIIVYLLSLVCSKPSNNQVTEVISTMQGAQQTLEQLILQFGKKIEEFGKDAVGFQSIIPIFNELVAKLEKTIQELSDTARELGRHCNNAKQAQREQQKNVASLSEAVTNINNLSAKYPTLWVENQKLRESNITLENQLRAVLSKNYQKNTSWLNTSNIFQ